MIIVGNRLDCSGAASSASNVELKGEASLASSSREKISFSATRLDFSHDLIFFDDPVNEARLQAICDKSALASVLGDKIMGYARHGFLHNDQCIELFYLLTLLFKEKSLYKDPASKKQLERMGLYLNKILASPKTRIEFGRYFRQEIADLQVGNKVVLFGGWHTSTEDHAVVLEIERVSKDNYRLRMHNTGAGIWDLHTYCGWYPHDYKATYLEFDNIQIGVILGEGPDSIWLETLFQLREIPLNLVDEKNSSIIYFFNTLITALLPDVSILSKIGKILFAPSATERKMHQTQRGMTCAWSCWIAWADSQLKLEDYKLFSSFIQTQVLLRSFIHWENDDPKLYTPSHLVIASARRLQYHAMRRFEQASRRKEPLFLAAGRVGKRIETLVRMRAVSECKDAIQLTKRGFTLCGYLDFSLSVLEYSKSACLREARQLASLRRDGTILEVLSEFINYYLNRSYSFSDYKVMFYDTFVDWILNLPPVSEMQSMGILQEIANNRHAYFEPLQKLQLSLLEEENTDYNIASFKLLAILHAITSIVYRDMGDGGLFERQKIGDVFALWISRHNAVITESHNLEILRDVKRYFAPYLDSKDLLFPMNPEEKALWSYPNMKVDLEHPYALVRWAYQFAMILQSRNGCYKALTYAQIAHELVVGPKNEKFVSGHAGFEMFIFLRAIGRSIQFCQETPKKSERDHFELVHREFTKIDGELHEGTGFGKYSLLNKFVSYDLVTREAFIPRALIAGKQGNQFYEERVLAKCEKPRAFEEQLGQRLTYSLCAILQEPAAVLLSLNAQIGLLQNQDVARSYFFALLKLAILDGDFEKMMIPLKEKLKEPSFYNQFAKFIEHASLIFVKGDREACLTIATIVTIARRFYYEGCHKDLFEDPHYFLIRDYIRAPFDVKYLSDLEIRRSELSLLDVIFSDDGSAKTAALGVFLRCLEQFRLDDDINSKKLAYLVSKEYRNRVYAWKERLGFKEINALVNQFVNLLGLPTFFEDDRWESFVFGTFIKVYGDEDYVCLNLLLGRIFTQRGCTKPSLSAKSVLTSVDGLFTKIFSHFPDKVYEDLTHYSFEMGSFLFRIRKVSKGNPIKKETLALFLHGKWMSYQAPLVMQKILPNNFLADCYIGFADVRERRIYGIDKKDDSLSIQVDETGIYDLKRAEEIIPVTCKLDLFTEMEARVSRGSDEVTLHFSGYSVWKGETPVVVLRGSEYILKSNPDFCLTLDSSNSIMFKNKKGNRVRYIPIGLFDLRESTSSQFSLLSDSSRRLMEYYEIVNSDGSFEVYSNSPEGMFYLALFEFQHHRYESFMSILGGLIKGKASFAGLENMIEEFILFSQDANVFITIPEYLASFFHLYLYLYDSGYSHPSLKKFFSQMYKHYLIVFDAIPTHLKVPGQKEFELASHFDVLPKWRREMLTTSDSGARDVFQTINTVVKKMTPIDITKSDLLRPEDVELSLFSRRGIELNILDELADVNVMHKLNGPLNESLKLQLIDFALRAPVFQERLYAFIVNNYTLAEMVGKASCRIFLILLAAIYFERREPGIFGVRYQLVKRDLEFLLGLTDFTEGKYKEIQENIYNLCLDVQRSKRLKINKVEVFKDSIYAGRYPPKRVHKIESFEPPSFIDHKIVNPLPPLFPIGDIFEIEDRVIIVPDVVPPEGIDRYVGQEWEIFKKEFVIGRERLFQRKRKIKLKPEVADLFFKQLGECIEKEEKELEEFAIRISSLLNRIPRENYAMQLRKDGLLEKPLQITDAIHLFLRNSENLFLKANSSLSKLDISQIMSLIGNYLVQATEWQHRKRVLQQYQLMLKDGLVARECHMYTLHEYLTAQRAYDPMSNPYLLAFEYAKNIRIRKEQELIITQMLSSNTDMVFQMMMGKGKTSVIAPIVLSLIPEVKPGCFGAFVVPKSQVQVNFMDLSTTMRKAFNKKLILFQPTAEELVSLSALQKIYGSLKDVIRCKNAIITTIEALQHLDLELKKLSEHVLSEEEYARFCEILKIIELFETKCHSVIDEVDTIIHPLREMNFPCGERLSIRSDDVMVIKKIFEALVSNDIDINGVTIREYVGILTNEQETRAEFFESIVIPKLGKYLAQKFASETYSSDELERLFTSKTPPVDALPRDRSDESRQIALIHHVLWDILPIILFKNAGRHYGRDPNQKRRGKVIPYRGVDAPASSEFGYHLAAACHQIVTALQLGVVKEEIKSLADELMLAATIHAFKEKRPVRETEENAFFFEITGMHLEEAKDIENCERIAVMINDERKEGNVKRLLAIEAAQAASIVCYHRRKMTANAQTVLSMFASRCAFSATPAHNIQTAPRSMYQHYFPDAGVEGEILALLLHRNEQSPCFHIAPVVHPVEMVEMIRALYPQSFDRVRMFIDAGGLFKDYDNKRVAMLIRDHLRRTGSSLKGVIYFARQKKMNGEEDPESPPDYPAFLPMWGDEVRYLPGTDKKVVSAICSKKHFIYLDEMHATGTDFYMPFDAVAAMTISKRLSYPRACQAVMRARQVLHTQSLHIICVDGLFADTGLPREMQSAVQLMIQAQAFEKQAVLPCSFQQKLELAVSSTYKQLLKEHLKKPEMISKLFKQFEHLITSGIVDDPLVYLSASREEVSSINLIQSSWIKIIEDLRNSFIRLRLDFKDHESRLVIEKESVYAESLYSEFLPPTMMGSLQDKNVSLEVAQVFEVDQNQQVVVTVENETEVMTTLEVISNSVPEGARERNQVEWDEVKAMAAIFDLENRRKTASIDCYMNSFINPFPKICILFRNALDQNVLCTENFAKVLDVPKYRDTPRASFPIFHHKTHPIMNMLLIQDLLLEYKLVLLTLTESEWWGEFLRERAIPNVWLINREGENISIGSPLILNDIKVRHLLVQVNAISGAFSYLSANMDAAKSWLEGGYRFEKLNLIKYGVLASKDPGEKYLYAEHPYFRGSVGLASDIIRMLAMGEEFEMSGVASIRKKRLLQNKRGEEIGEVSVEDVNYLGPHQVRHLTQIQINALEDQLLIEALEKEQINQIRNVDILHRLNDAQTIHMTEYQRRLIRPVVVINPVGPLGIIPRPIPAPVRNGVE